MRESKISKCASLKRLFAASLLAAITVGGTFIANSARAEDGVTDNEILIGALGPLTGATAFVGGPARDGLQLGFEKINAQGGINGRKIKFIFEQAFSPAESVAAAKKLVEDHKVFVLILASGSTGAAAAADYVRASGIPTYNIVGGTPIIRNPFAKNVFHGAITDASKSAESLAELVKDKLKAPRSVGVLAGTYAFPQAELKGVQAHLKGIADKIDLEQFDQGARDYTSQLLAFKKQDAGAVVMLGSFSEAGFAIKQASEMGLSNLVWVLAGTAATDGIIPIISPNIPRDVWSYSFTPFLPGQKAPTMDEFNALWTKRYGAPPAGRPNLYDMIGYGSAFVLAQALNKTGPNLTRDRLIAVWSTLQDAKPSNLGGIDVTYPESFSETDHQGNKVRGQAHIVNGAWVVVPNTNH